MVNCQYSAYNLREANGFFLLLLLFRFSQHPRASDCRAQDGAIDCGRVRLLARRRQGMKTGSKRSGCLKVTLLVSPVVSRSLVGL